MTPSREMNVFTASFLIRISLGVERGGRSDGWWLSDGTCKGWLVSLTAGGPQNHRLGADEAVSTHLQSTSTWIFGNPEVSGERALADEKDEDRGSQPRCEQVLLLGRREQLSPGRREELYTQPSGRSDDPPLAFSDAARLGTAGGAGQDI